jgi:hypothetical protein
VIGPVARRGGAARARAGARAREAARKGTLLAFAGVLLALAGCGGSSGNTKADYVKKVNALCATEQKEINLLANSHSSLIALVSSENRVREKTAALIEAVKEPSSEPISPEWMNLRRAAIAAANKVAAAGLPSKTANQQTLVFNVATQKARTIASEYGLSECKAASSA